ncbi:MAG: type I methionyl aminopeptidase [Eubacteriales bacterium]|nr:type I methionyl aminopeptidase [Eubacteriales bacterium]
MIFLRNEKQLDKMRKAGAVLYEILQKLAEAVRPGMSTLSLDAYAEELIRRAGAVPSFLNYQGFPNSICTSVDDTVVHGIPSDSEILKEGSIISIDCGLILDGWQSDSAITVPVGAIAPEVQRLIDVTEQCFFEGAKMAVADNRLGDIGYAVQSLAEKNNYGVIRELTGHGIGKNMHEDPNVPNYGEAGKGVRLKSGMTIALEPMISMGSYDVEMHDDGWRITTADGSFCAHYEHTIAIGEGLPEILSYPGFSWDEYFKNAKESI